MLLPRGQNGTKRVGGSLENRVHPTSRGEQETEREGSGAGGALIAYQLPKPLELLPIGSSDA
eukprot:2245202-Pyramimonas_sp.AAC.1